MVIVIILVTITMAILVCYLSRNSSREHYDDDDDDSKNNTMVENIDERPLSENIQRGIAENGIPPFALSDSVKNMVSMVVYPVSQQTVDIDIENIDVVDFCIPRIIHVCWRNSWVASSLFESVLTSNRKMVEGFETRFYTNATIMEFLQSHFPPVVLETYLLINPEYGACMSDFFRYCVLYVFGGMYIDLKTHIIRPLTQLWEKHFSECDDGKLVYLSYWPMARYHHIQSLELNHPDGEIMNWVMCASPGHPFFKMVIDEMVKNIQAWHIQKYRYGEKINVLRLTGPIFLTRMVLQARKKDPSIVVSETLNDYVRYTHTTSLIRIENDRSMYKESGVAHYSAMVDQIILFRHHSSSRFIFYFDDESSHQTLSPLEQSLNKIIMSQSRNGGRRKSSSTWTLRPIPSVDTRKRFDIVRDALMSLDTLFDSDNTEDTDVWLARFGNLPLQDQDDFIRCAVLYDHGGYFINPQFVLYSVNDDLQDMFLWDAYTRQVDVCLLMDKNRNMICTKSLMQFPAQSPVLKLCMTNLLMKQKPRSYKPPLESSLSYLLTTMVKDTRSYLGNPHRQSNIIPMGNSKYSETWMIATLQPISNDLWKSVWTDIPSDAQYIAHFTGQIIGMFPILGYDAQCSSSRGRGYPAAAD